MANRSRPECDCCNLGSVVGRGAIGRGGAFDFSGMRGGHPQAFGRRTTRNPRALATHPRGAASRESGSLCCSGGAGLSTKPPWQANVNLKPTTTLGTRMLPSVASEPRVRRARTGQTRGIPCARFGRARSDGFEPKLPAASATNVERPVGFPTGLSRVSHCPVLPFRQPRAALRGRLSSRRRRPEERQRPCRPSASRQRAPRSSGADQQR